MARRPAGRGPADEDEEDEDRPPPRPPRKGPPRRPPPSDSDAGPLDSDSGPLDAGSSDEEEADDLLEGGPFGSSDAGPVERGPARPPGKRDPRVKFPFGSTVDGADPLGDSSASARGARAPDVSSGRRLPGLPPDALLSDDASLEGLDPGRARPPVSDEGELIPDDDDDSDDDARPVGTSSDDEEVVDLGDPDARRTDEGPVRGRSVSEVLGPVGASGPLVIIDDDAPEASSRYQASIVDDSARLAGAASLRAPKGKKPSGKTKRARAGEERKRGAEAADDDVPVPGRSARLDPPPRPSRAPFVVAVLAVLLAIGAVVFSELRLRQAKAAFEAALADAVAAERAKGARNLDQAKKAADEALARATGEAEARRAEERATLERAAAVARDQAAAEARRQAEEQARAEAERRAREAVAVELARAEREKAAAVDEAVARTAAEEQAKARAALAEQAKRAEEQKKTELERLKEELEAELAGSATRAEEEALARELEAARDAEGGAGGAATGGGAAGGDEWDSFFEGGGAGGAGGTTAEGEPAPEGDEAASLHPLEQAWGWAKENLHGSVGYKNLSHFSRGDLRKTRHELRAKLEYRGWLWRTDDQASGLRLESALDVRVDDDKYAVAMPHGIDDEERRRPIVWPEELHLDLTIDLFTVRAGWQVYAWGTGDLFNPTDTINPIDFSDLFDTRRISVLSASAQVTTEHLSLEVVSVPSFTRSRLPLKGKRFDVLQTSPLPVLRPDDPAQTALNAQWGARATAHAGGWDVSVCGFTGWDDLPSARLALLSLNPLSIVIDPVFDRIHMAGADFATTLGFLGVQGRLGDLLAGVQLHGEVAHYWYEGPRTDDFAQYVFGLNYSFIDVILEHDITLVLEYAGDLTTSEADEVLPGTRLNRVLRGAALARIVYAVDDDLSFEVNSAIITHGDENALIHPAATWNVTDNLRLVLGGDVFVGPEETFFGQFKRDGRVTFELKVVF